MSIVALKLRNRSGAKGTQEGSCVTKGLATTQPPTVPAGAKQDGEIYDRWSWVEVAVWTPRMLTALETGLKGGKWFSLIDKVYAPANLYVAWQTVRANAGAAGVDQQTVELFEQNLAAKLANLSEGLRDGSYRPAALRRKWLPKPGSREARPLGIPTVRDRVVQTALRNVLEPIFERTFAAHSYGFRPQRGAKDALRRVDELLKAGQVWVVDSDLKSYFDTIPHAGLRARIEEQVADGRVLALLEAFLAQAVLGELNEPQAVDAASGTPQGAVISPLLANIYLNPLDHLMAGRSWEMVRYADDFVILCGTEAAARQALHELEQWTQTNGLGLHPAKTRLVNAQADGFDFLGYRFERGQRWPRKKSARKLKETIRRLTRRNNGEPLAQVIERVNQTLRGWYEYFKHSNRWTFKPLDQWIRMRLRSILRRRAGKRGRGRGSDHQRWPNAYFDALELFNLEAAQARDRQSLQR